MPNRTRQCQLKNLRPEISNQIYRLLSTDEKIIVCYETEHQEDRDSDYYFQLLTQKQMVLVTDYRRRQSTKTMLLADIVNIRYSDAPADHRVYVRDRVNNSLAFLFGSQRMAQEFSDLLRNAQQEAMRELADHTKQKSDLLPNNSTKEQEILQLIQQLKKLKEIDAITEEEFQKKKAELLRRF